MFTGLIEAVGTVVATHEVSHGRRIEFGTELTSELEAGESIAVNGVCLTVTGRSADAFAADVGPETIRATTLGVLRPGQKVNLERSLRAGDRLGGHFVQGHVDGTGVLVETRPAAEFTWMVFSFPPEHAAWLIPKGAIAVDGISLTIASLAERRFDVQIVPFTWTHTNLATLQPGDSVNLECDMLGKYAVRAAQLVPGRVPTLP
jgi:riboflavin synthase